ncbi:MAG: phasin family protein [Kiritimatiellia bacterium]
MKDETHRLIDRMPKNVTWVLLMTLLASRPGVGAPYVILKDGDRRIDAQWFKYNPNGDVIVITAEGKTRFRREDLKELHIDPPEHWLHRTHSPLNTNMVEFIEANPWVKHDTEQAARVVSFLALQKKGGEATAFAGKVMRANEEARTNTTFQAAYWQALLAAGRRAELAALLAEVVRTGTPSVVAHAQVCPRRSPGGRTAPRSRDRGVSARGNFLPRRAGACRRGPPEGGLTMESSPDP